MKQATIYVLGGVAVAIIAAVTLLVLYGPHDIPTQIAEGAAALFALFIVPLASWLLRDADGDGTPDIFQKKASDDKDPD